MRLAILSDVHGNFEALSAVLRDLEKRSVDEIACLGDLVGYGADPDRCVDEIFARCRIVVAGNHDLAAAGLLDTKRFNPLASAAVEYTRRRLGDERLGLLRALPLEEEVMGALMVHACPLRPELFPYHRNAEDAAEVFREWRGQGPIFYGHTHVAVSFRESVGGPVETRFGPRIAVSKASRVLCNVGSVGQPRDHDPRACYGILDTRDGSFTRHRVEYAVELAAKKIRDARLPEALGQRLRAGV